MLNFVTTISPESHMRSYVVNVYQHTHRRTDGAHEMTILT